MQHCMWPKHTHLPTTGRNLCLSVCPSIDCTLGGCFAEEPQWCSVECQIVWMSVYRESWMQQYQRPSNRPVLTVWAGTALVYINDSRLTRNKKKWNMKLRANLLLKYFHLQWSHVVDTINFSVCTGSMSVTGQESNMWPQQVFDSRTPCRHIVKSRMSCKLPQTEGKLHVYF